MARISGVDLPREKRVEIGLTYIYGIGRASSNRILAEAGVNPDTRVKDLTDDEVKKLASIIADTQTVEGDLRREIAMNIKRLQEIGCYRGIRHRKSLPVREKVPGAFYEANGIAVDEKKRPVVDHNTLETSVKGVYVAGDGLCGPATVVEGIRDGKKAAEAIVGRDLSE